MKNRCLVVISYYDRRPVHDLLGLLKSLEAYQAGDEYEVCIVVNRTKNEDLILPSRYRHIPVGYRHNVGMNIGAWDYGWRHNDQYRDYLFLQHECYVICAGWLAAYRKALSNDVGMVGESLNRQWDNVWSELRESLAGSWLPEHSLDGCASNRVDYYLEMFRRQGISPGKNGRHLRSLIWFMPRDVLVNIDGFIIGRNYGECIAAEIGTSKKVEALGMTVQQANEDEFSYIRHSEYNQDKPGMPFTQRTRYISCSSIERYVEQMSVVEFAKVKIRKQLQYFRIKS
jgi:hypothetical protein